MAIRLHDTYRVFEIRTWQEARSDKGVRSFPDVPSALHFLRGFLYDAFAMAALREVATERLQAPTQFLRNDHDVLEQIAWFLATGQLHLVTLERSEAAITGGGAGSVVPVEAPSGEEPLPPEEPVPVPHVDTSWVTFQVVDDETGMPVPGVPLRLHLPDGTTGRYTTDADGTVHLADLPAGVCALEEVCDEEGVEIVQFA